MTLRYCDFCGQVIPEDEDCPIDLGDPESGAPDVSKDACTTCYRILYDFAKYQNLRLWPVLIETLEKALNDLRRFGFAGTASLANDYPVWKRGLELVAQARGQLKPTSTKDGSANPATSTGLAGEPHDGN